MVCVTDKLEKLGSPEEDVEGGGRGEADNGSLGGGNEFSKNSAALDPFVAVLVTTANFCSRSPIRFIRVSTNRLFGGSIDEAAEAMGTDGISPVCCIPCTNVSKN